VKRCPHCDFIYEDDQLVCDLDGTALVHDSRPLPANPSPQRAIPPAKPGRRLIAIGAIAGVILLFFLFYVFTPGTAPQNTSLSSSKVSTGPQSAPNADPPGVTATATPSLSKEPKANVNAVESSSRIVRASPAHSRSPARKREDKKSKPENNVVKKVSRIGNPENTNAKKESRIGSFLKKTGRKLKKPFRF
jgi:hypothetical protein